MKKFITITGFILLVSMAFAQGTQRMVLWEEFTSGSCGPCAGVNPQITNYWNNNPTVVVGIQYHMSWPLANDPMYLNNPDDNNARRGVYGVNSIPWAVIDGDRFSNNVNNVNSLINIVENAYNNEPSSFDLQLSYELNDAQDQLLVTAMVSAVEEVSDLNARLYLPIIEKYIHLNSPQPNGEQDFYNVLKAFTPSSSGVNLPDYWEENDYMIYQFTWDVYGFYDINEIGLIGFIQNSGSSLGIQQSGYGSDTQITPNFSNDMAVIDLKTPQVICNNNVSPILTIRNQGSDPLTSATIKYSVNGGDEVTYEWTGNLNFLESETIDLDEVTFDTESVYNISATIENPNNTADEYIKNNTISIEIPQSAYLPQNCKIAILTDDNPEETTWDIKNSAGDIIASGGPYTMSSIFIESFEWTGNDCYTFTIYDAGGDGLDGGFYKITNSSTQVIWEGDNDFQYEATAEFAYDELMGVESSGINGEFSVYPNPVVETAQVEFTLLQQSTVQLGIFDLLGKRIIQIYDGIMPLGPQNYSIDTQNLDNGVYFVKISIDGQEQVQKIQIVK